MSTGKKQSNKKAYRVVQIEGKTSWRVEELWEGGIVGGPYSDKEAAIHNEENIATAEGFIADLVLQEAVGEGISHKDAFKKDSDGIWHCIQGCSIEMDKKELVFSQGMTFTKGIPYMGLDVAEWLDENPDT